MTLTYHYNEKDELLSIFEVITYGPNFFDEAFKEIEIGIHLSKNDYEKYKEMLSSNDSTVTAIAIEIIKNKL